MADKVTKKADTVAEFAETKTTAQPKPETKKKTVALYSIDDLAKAEKQLDAHRIVIRTALKNAGKKMYSIGEAAEIVKKFKEKEVK